MVRCCTCRYYVEPVRAKRGLCLLYERRNAGPRVMAGFSCDLWDRRSKKLDRRRIERLISSAVDDIKAARRGLARLSSRVQRVQDAILDKAQDTDPE